MSTDLLLSRLERVKRSGDGRWIAACPAHVDGNPSLSIRQTDDGRTLVHCFAQCPVEDVLAAVGLDFGSLFPERVISDHAKRERRPFNAYDVLSCIATESLIVAIVASDIVKGRPILEVDRERIILAASRIEAARVLVYGG